MQLLLGLVEQVAAGPVDDHEIFRLAALILVVFQHHRGQVHAGEHVAETRRQVLFLFQVTAERQHGNIDRERE